MLCEIGIQSSKERISSTYTMPLKLAPGPNGITNIVIPVRLVPTRKAPSTPNALDDFEKIIADTNNTSYTRSFGIDKSLFPEEITTFDAIEKYLPVCIGDDYVKIITPDYLRILFNKYDPIFKKPTDTTLESDITSAQALYNQIVSELKTVIKESIKKYTIKTNYSGDSELLDIIGITETNIAVKNELANNTTATISIDSIPSVDEYYETLQMDDRINSDIELLIVYLAKLSELSAYFSKNENSYRSFIGDMIVRMHGNWKIVNYPRSIINYSAFGFCINGYPYSTKSKEIYSINNILHYHNKLDYYMVYENNVSAVLKFLADIDFSEDENTTAFNKQIEILKNAFGMLLGLLCLKGERKGFKSLKDGTFESDVVKRDPLRTSRREDL